VAVSSVLPGVERIVVLRANGLGDLVFALPALAALRGAYPRAGLTLLGLDWHEQLLAGRGLVDRVEVVPRGARQWPRIGRDAPRELGEFVQRMAAEPPDLAVQLHGGGRESNHLVRALRPGWSLGYRTSDAPELDLWLRYDYWQSEVLRWVELVALVGAAPADLVPRLPVLPADVAAADPVVGGLGPLVVLHPGSGDPRRRWPVPRFAEVARALRARGLDVVLVGREDERALCARLAREVAGPVLDLSGRLSLPALVGVLSRAALLIGNDSGPLHLAQSVGTATVGLFWGPNLVTAGPLRHELHRPVPAWGTKCPECATDLVAGGCGHAASLLTELRVDAVLEAALDLLSERERRPGVLVTRRASVHGGMP
jgi:ADP-heptose:LPS heptosyltransferase